MVVSLSKLVRDAVFGYEARIVRTLAMEGLFVRVPAHGRAQHLAQERAVARRLALRARHHRVCDVAEQLQHTDRSLVLFINIETVIYCKYIISALTLS